MRIDQESLASLIDAMRFTIGEMVADRLRATPSTPTPKAAAATPTLQERIAYSKAARRQALAKKTNFDDELVLAYRRAGRAMPAVNSTILAAPKIRSLKPAIAARRSDNDAGDLRMRAKYSRQSRDAVLAAQSQGKRLDYDEELRATYKRNGKSPEFFRLMNATA